MADFGWSGASPLTIQPGDFPGSVASASTAAATSVAKAGAGTFLGISPIGWGVIGVSLIGSLLMRGKKKRPPPEATGVKLGSLVDANAPWIKVYGQPWFSPPLVNQYAEPERLNSTNASKTDERERVTGRPVFVSHTGAGPVDGKGLQVRYGQKYITSETITADSPAEARTLTHKPGSGGAVWLFPAMGGDLIESSVQIKVDGTLVYSGGAGAGGTGTTDTEAVAAKFCAAEDFTDAIGSAWKNGNRDATIGGKDNITTETRTGCFLPKSGLIDDKSVTATIHFGQSSSLVAYTVKDTAHKSAVGAKSMKLNPADWGFSQTDDAKQYFYVRKVTNSANGQQVTAGASASSRCITGFTLAYSVKTNAYEVSITPVRDGEWEARFSPSISSTAVVTATYSVSTSFKDARYSFRTGQLDQSPATDEDKGFFGPNTDATRTTVIVGTELTKGTARTYTTTGAVDDVLVCIESGSKGFYGTDKDGNLTGLGRSVTMRFKESTAATTGTTLGNIDPSKGWVVLKPTQPDAKYADSIFRLRDYFTGQGQWYFSVADLFAFAQGKSKGTNSGNWLPPRAYVVEVTAVDAAGVNEAGIVNTDRYFSDLFFATATEIRRVGLVLPRQSTLTVSLGPDSETDGRLECRFAGASVVQATSAAATVGDDGLPTPRTVGYSRNPVWCACDLITDELVGGGQVFDWDDIDLSSAYTAAAWCDATVTLRDGTTQVRSQCDVVIGEDGRKPLGEWLATILAGSGVMCYWRGTWRFVVDEDAAVATDPVTSAGFVIDEEADCVPATAELSFATAEELPSELVIQFKDSENVDAESQEAVYFDDPQPTPRITDRVEFPAVRRRKQARHFGSILLRQMRRATRRLRMQGTIGRGLRLLMLDPGDIVYVTSTRLGLSAVKFRVMTVGWTSGMRPAVELVEHSSSSYTDDFAGPNSGVRPGQRQPTNETPAPSQLKVTHVTGASLQTVGGAP